MPVQCHAYIYVVGAPWKNVCKIFTRMYIRIYIVYFNTISTSKKQVSRIFRCIILTGALTPTHRCHHLVILCYIILFILLYSYIIRKPYRSICRCMQREALETYKCMFMSITHVSKFCVRKLEKNNLQALKRRGDKVHTRPSYSIVRSLSSLNIS